MKLSEMLRLVLININQNKFKTVMTSIGIVVGAATIVLVIAIGRGGRMDVAEQFQNLNAGAIDVTYEYAGTDTGSSGFSFGGFFGDFAQSFGGRGRSGSSGSSDGSRKSRPSGENSSGGRGRSGDDSSFNPQNAEGGNPPGMSGEGDSSAPRMPGEGDSSAPGMPGEGDSSAPGMNADRNQDMAPGSEPGKGSDNEAGNASGGEGENESGNQEGDEEKSDLTGDRMNQEKITLTQGDVDDIKTFVTGISGATISYTIRADVEGAELTQAQSYTIAGVKAEYFDLSNLKFAAGESFTDADDDSSSRICVLGSSRAKELFGSAEEAEGEKLYLADRAYTVVGVLESSQTVFAGISPDEVIFVPYGTGIKYIAGTSADPRITVIAEDVDLVSQVEDEIQAVLSKNYNNAEFAFADAGSKMEAAESSNRILTMLLTAMAAIVFLVGGIGIMNVLFVSVRERTGEIGVLKALGASRRMILGEFLTESAAISLIGGSLGVGISFLAVPLVRHFGVRVETSVEGCLAALGFAVLTGTLFGLYPAWKASQLQPVDALNEE